MNQLKAGAALSYLSIALNMVVGLVYTPYLLRMLGQSEYGLYSLAASLIAYLTVLDLGFGNAIVRYTAKFRTEGKLREQEEMFGMFFLLYIVIGILAVALGTVLSLNVGRLFDANMTPVEMSRTRTMLWLMTLNLAFTFPMSLWGSIMTAYERFVFQRVVSIFRSVLNPVVMLLLLVLGYKAVALVVVTTLFNVVTLLVNWWYCRRRLLVKVRFGHFNWPFLKEVSVYSFWIFLNVIMDRIYWSTGQFVLGIYRGSVAISVYAVAIHLQQMFMLFSTAISGVFLPKVTAMVTKGDDFREVSGLFIRTGRLQYIVIGFILSSFIVFGRPFVVIWAGPAYEDAYVMALLFLVPLAIPLIQSLGIIILQARNRMKFRSLLYLCISFLSLILSVSLARVYGGVGCAVATALALLLGQGLIMNVYYHRVQHLDILKFWCEILKMSVVPALSVLLGLWAFGGENSRLYSVPGFLKAVAVFVPVYFIAFWFFGMNREERRLFVQPLKRLKALGGR